MSELGVLVLVAGAVAVAGLSRRRGWPAPLVVVLVGLVVSELPHMPAGRRSTRTSSSTCSCRRCCTPPPRSPRTCRSAANLRPIALLSVGLVVFTTVVVAVTAWWLIGPLTIGTGVRARRRGRAAGRGGRDGGRADARAAPPGADDPGRGEPAQRRHRADALPGRRSSGRQRDDQPGGGLRAVRGHGRGRHRRRADHRQGRDLAAVPAVRRRAREHRLAAGAVRRVRRRPGAAHVGRAGRGPGRADDRARGPAHPVLRGPAAVRGGLAHDRLPARVRGVHGDRAAAADRAGAGSRVRERVAARRLGRVRPLRGHRDAVRVGLPGDLRAAVDPQHRAARPGAATGRADGDRLGRDARRRDHRRRRRRAVEHRRRRRVPAARPGDLPGLRRRGRDAGDPGLHPARG